MRLKILLNIMVCGSLASCDHRPATVYNPNDLYFDYRITGEEDDDVACVLQYKRGGPDGEAIMIREPGSVELDGVKLEADSAGFSGIYYEQYIPSEEFIGTHSIVHTSPDKKTYREEFEYTTFQVEELQEKIKRTPFTIRLLNFPQAKTRVRLVLIDTAFSNNDVIDLVYVQHGELQINQSMLSQLTSGPVSMEIYREEERAVKNGTAAGGRIFISYGLQRDFELVD